MKYITVNELERKLRVLKAFLDDQHKLALLTSHGDGTFGNDLVYAYLDALSIAAGDEEMPGFDTWLRWYVWNNDFGKRKLTAKLGDKEIIVDRVGRLMKCIEYTRGEEEKHITERSND